MIDGDIDDDGVPNDVTLMKDQNQSLLTLDTDGINVESSVIVDFDVDDIFGFTQTPAILVTADDASFENLGSINASGIPLIGFGDFISAVEITGDNFTLTNSGEIVTTGRFAVEAFSVDENTGNMVDLYTTVLNDGLLESGDDAIRLMTGIVVNDGTITTTGTFEFFDIAGFAADGISVRGPRNANFVSPNGEASTIVNNGLIDGHRSGIFFVGDGSINNTNLIEGQASAIFAQGDFFGLTTDLIINNSGTLIRNGEDFGFNFNDAQLNGYAAISIAAGRFDSATITNSGTIESTDIAIAAISSGVSFTNELGGLVNSNTDGIDDGVGDDGVAFFGAELETFRIVAVISENFATPNQILDNAQGITIDTNGEYVIPGIGTVFNPGSVEVAFVGGVNPLLPLVDLAATQNSGVLTFQSDANGVIYPATIDVTSATLGVLTVTYVSGTGFDITDSNGDPVFDVPADVDFGDTITNDGTINGDISTGLGDDMITNNFTIDGDVLTGLGDDTVVNLSLIHI